MAGDWIYFQRDVHHVFSVDVEKRKGGNIDGDKVVIHLGRGRYWEPIVRTFVGQSATVASPQPLDGIEARFVPPVDARQVKGSPPPSTVRLPTKVTDRTTGHIVLSAVETTAMAQAVDEWGWGPSGFSAPYDVTVDVHGQNHRILEGTMTVIRSTSLPVIDPSWEPDPKKPDTPNPNYWNSQIPWKDAS